MRGASSFCEVSCRLKLTLHPHKVGGLWDYPAKNNSKEILQAIVCVASEWRVTQVKAKYRYRYLHSLSEVKETK